MEEEIAAGALHDARDVEEGMVVRRAPWQRRERRHDHRAIRRMAANFQASLVGQPDLDHVARAGQPHGLRVRGRAARQGRESCRRLAPAPSEEVASARVLGDEHGDLLVIAVAPHRLDPRQVLWARVTVEEDPFVAFVPEISHATTAPRGWQKLFSHASSGRFGMAKTAIRDDIFKE